MYRKRNLGCTPTFLHVVSLRQRLPNPGSQGVKPCLIRIMIRLIYISGKLRDAALPATSTRTGVISHPRGRAWVSVSLKTLGSV